MAKSQDVTSIKDNVPVSSEYAEIDAIVKQRMRQLQTAMLSGNIEEALSIYHEDVFIARKHQHPIFGRPVFGKQDLRQRLEAMQQTGGEVYNRSVMGGGRIDFDIKSKSIEYGDFAFFRAFAKVTAADGTVKEEGWVCHIWKKVGDNWFMHENIADLTG